PLDLEPFVTALGGWARQCCGDHVLLLDSEPVGIVKHTMFSANSIAVEQRKPDHWRPFRRASGVPPSTCRPGSPKALLGSGASGMPDRLPRTHPDQFLHHGAPGPVVDASLRPAAVARGADDRPARRGAARFARPVVDTRAQPVQADLAAERLRRR